MQTAVAFLTTIFKVIDKDYWGKLNQAMKYIKRQLGVNLNLRADILSVINWWLDAAFSMYNNFQGYNGGILSLVVGAITSGS